MCLEISEANAWIKCHVIFFTQPIIIFFMILLFMSILVTLREVISFKINVKQKKKYELTKAS